MEGKATCRPQWVTRGLSFHFLVQSHYTDIMNVPGKAWTPSSGHVPRCLRPDCESSSKLSLPHRAAQDKRAPTGLLIHSPQLLQ